MKEGFIKDTYELIINKIQTVLTAFYIVSVGIGMLFNYHKYSEFEINIFNYSDVFDFLIAPFSDFHILFFTTASILFVSILIKLDSIWRKKWPKSYSKAKFGQDKKSWYKVYRKILFIIGFILYLILSADFYGKYTKNKIMNEKSIFVRFEDNEINSGKLIGKTKDVIFLLKNQNVYVIPIHSLVKEIELK